ncbi:hypothetical protein LTS15_007551 [Exophiala xenobiotica]|nr:hypothetical protein LTS15_007551 [Exophiala xenobiotica]
MPPSRLTGPAISRPTPKASRNTSNRSFLDVGEDTDDLGDDNDEDLGDFTVFLKPSTQADYVSPKLASVYQPLNQLPGLPQFLNQKYRLLRELEKKQNETTKKLLDEVDSQNYTASFGMYSTKAFASIVLASSPPSFETWMSLPSAFELPEETQMTHFIVYNHVWTKQNGYTLDVQVYTGVAESVLYGCYPRITRDYHPYFLRPNSANYRDFSTHCKECIEDGWVFKHIGVALIVPRGSIIPPLQAYMKAMEGVITYTTWTPWRGKNSSHQHHYLRKMCKWDVDSLPYRGLNSRNPMMEGVRVTVRWDSEFLNSLPSDPKERGKMLRGALWAEDNRILELHRLGELASDDEQVEQVVLRRARREQSRERYNERTSRALAKYKNGELGSSDVDVQSAKKKKETGKKNNKVKAGRRIKDRVVHAEHEAGNINTSDSDYQSATKRIESRKSTKRKAAAKIQDKDKNVLREHKDGEINSSDGDYKAAKRRREAQRIRNARHHDKKRGRRKKVRDTAYKP